jgi:sugar phosphate isomerase/epimerase
MQLGFVTAILPELSLEEVLKFAATCGYECIEVMCWPPSKADRRYAGVTHIDVTTLDDRQIGNIQNLVAKHGVAISGLGYYPNPLSPNEQEAASAVAHLRRVIEAAPRLGIHRVNSSLAATGRSPSTTIGRGFSKPGGRSSHLPKSTA